MPDTPVIVDPGTDKPVADTNAPTEASFDAPGAEDETPTDQRKVVTMVIARKRPFRQTGALIASIVVIVAAVTVYIAIPLYRQSAKRSAPVAAPSPASGGTVTAREIAAALNGDLIPKMNRNAELMDKRLSDLENEVASLKSEIAALKSGKPVVRAASNGGLSLYGYLLIAAGLLFIVWLVRRGYLFPALTRKRRASPDTLRDAEPSASN